MQAQPLTPEQAENQKVDMKVAEMEQKESLRNDPSQLSPIDALREAMMPTKPKLKPVPRIKVLSNNGQLLGAGQVSKKG